MDYFWILICLTIARTVAHAHFAREEKKKCKKNHYTPCVQNLCCCRETDAYCEGHAKRLGYIPKLPRHIRTFAFMGNFLPQLSKETFANVSHLNLTSLSIINDGVLRTTEDTFVDLPTVSILNISSNTNINKTDLSLSFNSISKTNLQTLNLKKIGLTGMIPERFFKGLEASNVRFLILGKNGLTYVNMSVFQYLPKLKYLELTNNAITEFTVDIGHPLLKSLHLASNKIGPEPPSFCLSEGTTFPMLTRLHLEENFISDIVPQAWKCLSNLTHLAIGKNVIRHIPNNTIADLTSLRELRVNEMLRYTDVHNSMTIDKFAFNSTSLRSLKLDSNHIEFKKVQVQNKIFAACRQITYLSISKNNLWELSEDDVTEMLSPLTQLEKLHMGSTSLRSIPNAILKHLSKLHYFEVDGNNIQELGDSLIGAQNLAKLSIQNNHLTVLKPESFPLSIRKTLRFLNLAGNSFDCSCDNLWFRNWIGDEGKAKGTNISLKRWPNHYKCYTPKKWNGKFLKSYKPTEASCRFLLILYASLGSIGGILFLLTVSVLIYTRYRWHIQYVLYKLTKTRKDDERRPLLDNEGNRLPTQPYVYVIYHESDRDFVHQALHTMVDEEFGFKLYTRERNAAHGSNMNAMFDAIDASSHVLAIVSSTSVADGWCEFQLEIGLRKINESRTDCLTLLLLENLDRCLLRRSWCVTLEKNATVRWCSDRESNQWRVCLNHLKSRLQNIP